MSTAFKLPILADNDTHRPLGGLRIGLPQDLRAVRYLAREIPQYVGAMLVEPSQSLSLEPPSSLRTRRAETHNLCLLPSQYERSQPVLTPLRDDRLRGPLTDWPLQGHLAHKKRRPPQEPPRAPGLGLR